jgi:hypothetical protein
VLSIDGFAMLLDRLLELTHARKVDLTKIRFRMPLSVLNAADTNYRAALALSYTSNRRAVVEEPYEPCDTRFGSPVLLAVLLVTNPRLVGAPMGHRPCPMTRYPMRW